MRFSIIMPSYLGNYKNAASNRERKIHRAVKSVLEQSFQDFELIVISDGCDKTAEIITPYVEDNFPKVRLLQIIKQHNFSGAVRNSGIAYAHGDIIVYLDIDDYFGTDHLKIIDENIGDYDWVYFNDLQYDLGKKEFYDNPVQLAMGKCGTSNFAHRRSMNIYWMSNNYLHDWVMINTLMSASSNYGKIPSGQYHCCHVPFPKRIDI